MLRSAEDWFVGGFRVDGSGKRSDIVVAEVTPALKFGTGDQRASALRDGTSSDTQPLC